MQASEEADGGGVTSTRHLAPTRSNALARSSIQVRTIQPLNATLKKAGGPHSCLVWSSLTGSNMYVRVDDYKLATNQRNPQDDPRAENANPVR